MEHLNINKLLNREKIIQQIKDKLKSFDENSKNMSLNRGIYIYGSPGSGKTYLIKEICKELDYDVISYNAGEIRNKNVINEITKYNMSNVNVVTMFQKKKKKIVILMDEIDGMNNGDKGGINALIKIIRPKKTKKQKQEEYSSNIIICIGNYHMDKKIKELMKVCTTFELPKPENSEILNVMQDLMPKISERYYNSITSFIQNDLRKMNVLYNMYVKDDTIFIKDKLDEEIKELLNIKSYNEDIKIILKNLLNNCYSIDKHNEIMNETDRTIIALLWHENVIDILSKRKNIDSIKIYNKLTDNMCFADYIDRITFQKQIWQFNEMTSLIKTMYNNNILQEYISSGKKITFNPQEVRFTKVLTKYSTEYNNSLFIMHLCELLSMNKQDLYSFFINIRIQNEDDEQNIYNILENYEIQKLDVIRMYKFIDRFLYEDKISEITEECEEGCE
jgi:DNA polymerase III delta prime subunit